MMKNLLSLICIVCLFSSCHKDEDKPTACFTYEITSPFGGSPELTNDTVIFTNCSENATSYKWDFGDGTTSTEENPTKIYAANMPVIVSLKAYNGSNFDVLTDTIWEWAMLYKPNIYIYPENTIDLCVSLNFPKGGKVVTSVPEYNNEWCVAVEPSGKINGNYDFLFYESIQPNIWQKEAGWIIPQNELSNFFNKNMLAYGFNTNEIVDFIEYWIPLLNQSNYYVVYPQTKSIIEQVVELEFTLKPKNLNRLFYVVEGVNEVVSILEPTINPFNKTGYYVNEWGVVL